MGKSSGSTGVLCVDPSGHYAIKCKFGGAIVCVSQYTNHVDFTGMSADGDHGDHEARRDLVAWIMTIYTRLCSKNLSGCGEGVAPALSVELFAEDKYLLTKHMKIMS